jgi:nucleoside-diphosphate-sugar epimerase
MLLLIGAAGFLGSAILPRLRSHDGIALVHRTPVAAQAASRLGDLAQPSELPLDGVDTVIYCASMALPSFPDVVHALEHAGVRRAIFVSTTALYTSLPAPSRARRLAAEDVVVRSRLDWTILRPTMIYGTARDRNISRLLRFLHRWPVFPVTGDALWQPVYVEDAAEAVVRALDRPWTIRRAYNIPGAAPLRFSSLVREAARAVRRGVLLLRVPLPLLVQAARATRVVTPEQVRRLAEDKAFDYAAAARDLDYAPRPFHVGVELEAASLGLA